MLFAGNDYNTPPKADELEVTVIGPGYGEAIAVHLGDRKWVLIDSCARPGDSGPASLQYLNDLGMAPSDVVAIVASHWDDDHIRGLAQLVASCADADFILSGALGKQEFTTYAEIYDRPLTARARSGVREMRGALRAAVPRGPLRLAASNKRIYSSADIPLAHGARLELWTLSPSDKEYDNFLVWLATQIPGLVTRRVAVNRSRNDLSAVVFISVGDDAMLFGGDLEEEGNANTGWSAIIGGSGRPRQKCSLFKIAHHGSPTGDHPEIWTELLMPAPTAALAPWKRGKGSLPSQIDVQRILGFTSDAYSTTSLAGRKPRARGRTVERTIKEASKSFSALPQHPGAVRFRKAVGKGAWQVSLFGDAVPLARVHS